MEALVLPDAIQGEKGRIITISCVKKRTPLVMQSLAGATVVGIIESIPGPGFIVREVSGALSVLASPNDHKFTWTWDETDTGIAGPFTVQFIGTIGGTIIYKSYPEPWKVVRSPATPV